MKTKLAILFVVVSFGVTSLRADDAPSKAANQSNSEFVGQRLGQIDLNVRLKQYRKKSRASSRTRETELAMAKLWPRPSRRNRPAKRWKRK